MNPTTFKKSAYAFRLPCDENFRHFYEVQIHRTRASMFRTIRKLRGSPVPERDRDAKAVCLRFVVVPRNPLHKELLREHDQIGIILFVEGQYTPPEATHELIHAAIGWARRNGINPFPRRTPGPDSDEEKFARTIEFMHDRFFAEFIVRTTIKPSPERVHSALP